MKKITFKIRKGTKQLILGLSILGILGLSYTHTQAAKKALPSMAIVGLVSSFKKKGIALTPEEEANYTAIDEAFAEHTKGLITTEALNTKWAEIKTGLDEIAVKKLVDAATTEMNDSLAKQAIEIDQLKTLGGNPGGNTKSLRQQIKDQLTSEGNKSAWAGFQNKQPGAQLQFSVKAAGNMAVTTTTAYTTAGTAIAMPSPEVIPGLNNVARNQPFLIQLLNVMGTGKANIIFTEKTNPQGNAYEVGEGVLAPLISFDIVIGDSRAKLVDGMIKVSVQMLDDIDYIASEIEKELIYQVAIRIDTQLLQGDGTGDNLKGIKAYAGGYTLTSLSTVNPNNADAILAAATQIIKNNFIPDIAVLNPIDYAQTKLEKGTTGYYIVNPNNQDSAWDKIKVVQSNQVPVGYYMVMDSSKSNVYKYEDFTITYGWVNDDFQKNLVSIMGKQRLHSFVKANDVLAFVYDSFANTKTAITRV